MSAFSEQMYQNAATSNRGLVTGGPDATVRRSWGDVHREARGIAGALASSGVGPGSAVAVLAGDAADVAPLAQAVWMRGASLTMLQQPTPRTDLAAWLADTIRAATMIRATLIVVGPPFADAVTALTAAGQRVATVADLRTGPAIEPLHPDESAVAMYQLTSGSTGTPKAVEITHANLMANSVGLVTALGVDASTEVMVSWLPLSHDMGMVGFLTHPMQLGIELVAVAPDLFLRRPALWPELITRHRGTITAGPNFAYALLTLSLERAEPGEYDLSTLRVAINGAEPIDPRDVRRLARAGSPFGLPPGAITPAYGMAETTLGICFDTSPAGRQRGCDQPSRSARVRHRDPRDRRWDKGNRLGRPPGCRPGGPSGRRAFPAASSPSDRLDRSARRGSLPGLPHRRGAYSADPRRTAGCAPVTWATSTSTAHCTCADAPRTSSSSPARTSTRRTSNAPSAPSPVSGPAMPPPSGSTRATAGKASPSSLSLGWPPTPSKPNASVPKSPVAWVKPSDIRRARCWCCPPGTAQDAIGKAATPQGSRIVRPPRCRIRGLHRATGGGSMTGLATPAAIVIDDLRIDRERPHRARSHPRFCPCRHHHGAAGPFRLREDHADACDRRRAADFRRLDHGVRRCRRRTVPASAHRLRDAVAEHLPGPDHRRERPLLRLDVRRRLRPGTPGDQRGRV